MKIIQGMGASSKVAIGKAMHLEKPKHLYQTEASVFPNQEMERFAKATLRAKSELADFISDLKAQSSLNYQIFAAHMEMIGDVLLQDKVEALILQGKSAEFAIENACDHFYRLLEKSEDEYLRQRKDDVLDVKDRLINALTSKKEAPSFKAEPFIAVAEMIYPSDIMRLIKYDVLGFVSKYGSVYSHTAILARSLEIPYICGLESDTDLIIDGDLLALDGKSGEVYLCPDDMTTTVFLDLAKKQIRKKSTDNTGKKLQAVTKSGIAISVMANANHVFDLDMILKQDADGIGLIRSEYLFSENEFYPTEEEQIIVYRQFLEKMDPLPTIIRTFDFSTDKPNQFINYEKEDNPALGYRGIRISLKEVSSFKIQLRALYRASTSGKLLIMFPMITNLAQVKLTKKIIEEVKTELDKEGFKYDPQVKIGLMIETPASALISDLLASEVDFFSIGTNDLIQYTLASDRQNARIAELYDDKHEAIKRLIQRTCQNAKIAGIKVALCGEMAENMDFLALFLECGIDQLSVSPAKVNEIKLSIVEHK